MRLALYTFLSIVLMSSSLWAQNPGDTIKVKTFHYGSNTRDTAAYFPSGNFTYEKIIMAYNMRCKNGLVSTSDNRNLGCGEWDYSCNTFIADSGKIEKVLGNQPNFVISNFSGSNFPFTTKKVYDYYRYSIMPVTVQSIGSDSVFSLTVNNNYSLPYTAGDFSVRKQHLYRASDLSMAGITAGPINSIIIPITNTGAKLHFLTVSIKQTLRTGMENAIPDSNLTTVYKNHFNFVNGNNRIVFTTPFNWDGSSNILLEFSFTNTSPTDSLRMLHRVSNFSSDLQFKNNTALDLSHLGHVELDTNRFSQIKNEITVAFWAYGNPDLLPQNSNSILYGTDANINNRQFNIHLPHSSSNVYFDCGFASGYDRINKLATPDEFEGKWNHWIFSKNASTGTMKIYLNGKLWASGTGKTKAINLKRLVLGKDINLNNNYKGRINQLSIWNKEITDSMAQTLMYKGHAYIDLSNNNLIAHYPLNEGTGNQITESSRQVSSTGANLRWTQDRGNELFYQAQVSELNPDIKFTRSAITFTTGQQFALDSVVRATNNISSYAVISNEGITPMKDDQVLLGDVTNHFTMATPSMLYNGDQKNTPIDSIPVSPEGTMTIFNLPFYRRFPWFNEIMSFVTPYGIGLNLGPTGKTWYYDVTDFAPILKGNKRILMTMGGQNQEQNDIEFWFIVGTPVRNVLDFNQVYQGANRLGNVSLNQINNGSRYPAIKVPTLSNASTFKFRSVITGHGAEGEFEANGGQVEHYLNFNNNAKKLNWVISQECAFNPIFPQGGTWVYDRQGWCPGESSLVKEWDISDVAKAGDSLQIDYDASTPPNPNGAYTYLVAHQLVSYGPLNHNLDARIMEVVHPTDNVLYTRRNPYCAQPKVVVQNSGKETIQSLKFEYWINSSEKQSFTWNGNLASLKSDTITLPIQNLYNSGMLNTGNRFTVSVVQANGKNDDYQLNNTYTTGFAKPEIIPSVFTLEFRTNNRPTENSFKIYDAWNNLVDEKAFTEANTTFTKGYNLGGCYRLEVKDSGHDGVQWWANSNQGTGFIRLKRANGQIIKTFQPDFGGGFEYYFTTNWALGKEENSFADNILVYPNPAHSGNFSIEGNELKDAMLILYDIMGKKQDINYTWQGNKIEVNAAAMERGIYLLQIINGDKTCTKVIALN